MTVKKKKRKVRKELRIMAFIIVGLILLIGGLVTYQLLSEHKGNGSVHVIVLDNAHGGDASGVQGLISEDEYNEKLIDALAKQFEGKSDYRIVRTHEDGQAMAVSTRVGVINDADADLVLSVRCHNAGSPNFNNTKIFAQPATMKYHGDSAAFAGLIRDAMEKQGVECQAGYYYYKPIKQGYYQEHLVVLEDETDYGEETWELMGADAPVVIVSQFDANDEAAVELWGSEEGIATAAKLYYRAITAMFDK